MLAHHRRKKSFTEGPDLEQLYSNQNEADGNYIFETDSTARRFAHHGNNKLYSQKYSDVGSDVVPVLPSLPCLSGERNRSIGKNSSTHSSTSNKTGFVRTMIDIFQPNTMREKYLDRSTSKAAVTSNVSQSFHEYLTPHRQDHNRLISVNIRDLLLSNHEDSHNEHGKFPSLDSQYYSEQSKRNTHAMTESPLRVLNSSSSSMHSTNIDNSRNLSTRTPSSYRLERELNGSHRRNISNSSNLMNRTTSSAHLVDDRNSYANHNSIVPHSSNPSGRPQSSIHIVDDNRTHESHRSKLSSAGNLLSRPPSSMQILDDTRTHESHRSNLLSRPPSSMQIVDDPRPHKSHRSNQSNASNLLSRPPSFVQLEEDGRTYMNHSSNQSNASNLLSRPPSLVHVEEDGRTHKNHRSNLSNASNLLSRPPSFVHMEEDGRAHKSHRSNLSNASNLLSRPPSLVHMEEDGRTHKSHRSTLSTSSNLATDFPHVSSPINKKIHGAADLADDHALELGIRLSLEQQLRDDEDKRRHSIASGSSGSLEWVHKRVHSNPIRLPTPKSSERTLLRTTSHVACDVSGQKSLSRTRSGSRSSAYSSITECSQTTSKFLRDDLFASERSLPARRLSDGSPPRLAFPSTPSKGENELLETDKKVASYKRKEVTDKENNRYKYIDNPAFKQSPSASKRSEKEKENEKDKREEIQQPAVDSDSSMDIQPAAAGTTDLLIRIDNILFPSKYSVISVEKKLSMDSSQSSVILCRDDDHRSGSNDPTTLLIGLSNHSTTVRDSFTQTDSLDLQEAKKIGEKNFLSQLPNLDGSVARFQDAGIDPETTQTMDRNCQTDDLLEVPSPYPNPFGEKISLSQSPKSDGFLTHVQDAGIGPETTQTMDSNCQTDDLLELLPPYPNPFGEKISLSQSPKSDGFLARVQDAGIGTETTQTMDSDCQTDDLLEVSSPNLSPLSSPRQIQLIAIYKEAISLSFCASEESDYCAEYITEDSCPDLALEEPSFGSRLMVHVHPWSLQDGDGSGKEAPLQQSQDLSPSQHERVAQEGQEEADRNGFMAFEFEFEAEVIDDAAGQTTLLSAPNISSNESSSLDDDVVDHTSQSHESGLSDCIIGESNLSMNILHSDSGEASPKLAIDNLSEIDSDEQIDEFGNDLKDCKSENIVEMDEETEVHSAYPHELPLENSGSAVTPTLSEVNGNGTDRNVVGSPNRASEKDVEAFLSPVPIDWDNENELNEDNDRLYPMETPASPWQKVNGSEILPFETPLPQSHFDCKSSSTAPSTNGTEHCQESYHYGVRLFNKKIHSQSPNEASIDTSCLTEINSYQNLASSFDETPRTMHDNSLAYNYLNEQSVIPMDSLSDSNQIWAADCSSKKDEGEVASQSQALLSLEYPRDESKNVAVSSELHRIFFQPVSPWADATICIDDDDFQNEYIDENQEGFYSHFDDLSPLEMNLRDNEIHSVDDDDDEVESQGLLADENNEYINKINGGKAEDEVEQFEGVTEEEIERNDGDDNNEEVEEGGTDNDTQLSSISNSTKALDDSTNNLNAPVVVTIEGDVEEMTKPTLKYFEYTPECNSEYSEIRYEAEKDYSVDAVFESSFSFDFEPLIAPSSAAASRLKWVGILLSVVAGCVISSFLAHSFRPLHFIPPNIPQETPRKMPSTLLINIGCGPHKLRREKRLIPVGITLIQKKPSKPNLLLIAFKLFTGMPKEHSKILGI